MHGVAAAAVVAVFAAVGAAAAQDPPSPAGFPNTPVVVTTGHALVRRAPDVAFVMVAVESRARNPRDAQRQNAELSAAVQQKLAAAALGKDAVRTLGYTIQQEFDFTNGRRVPRDYVARNAIEIRVEAVERVGELLDVVVQAGATAVGGVRFDLRDRAAAEREALRLAVVDARARADAAAGGAGQTVVRVLRIDDTRPPRIEYPERQLMMARAPAADAAETPIEPGVIEIRADVTVTAAIK
jgi:uncharacterized protein YggE